MESALLNKTQTFQILKNHAEVMKECFSNKVMMNFQQRNNALFFQHNEFCFDCTRQLIDLNTLEMLQLLAKEIQLNEIIKEMKLGGKVNKTENRAVLHYALRYPISKIASFYDRSILEKIHAERMKVKKFSDDIRSGKILGYSKKMLTNIICVGIGGSNLGTEFVYEALNYDKNSVMSSEGRKIRFLSNIDPVDVKRAIKDITPDVTLVIVISKTFTTAETILNAKTLKQWILSFFNNDEKALGYHMCAVSTNHDLTGKFGIPNDKVFGFWEWIGGRFSVCSSVGILPLSIHFGWDTVEEFLSGCHDIDEHFFNTKGYLSNIPIIMGLIAVYNSVFLGIDCVAVLPYSQALSRFPAYVQQLCMESNGKHVTANGEVIKNYSVGEIFFGEPGTNSQHSFFQLLHQGKVVSSEFIGFSQSEFPIKLPSENVSNHDELMSNFFAQPDALFFGGSCLQSQSSPHKIFEGNRPSTILLFRSINPYNIGQLLALYEHRTVVEGFILGINPFDQFGVELGKVLASNVRKFIQSSRSAINLSEEPEFYPPTRKLLDLYIQQSSSACETSEIS